jgi:hypothetical protein
MRPQRGFAASAAFDPEIAVSLRLRAAYEATMPELYFGLTHCRLGTRSAGASGRCATSSDS